MRCNVLFLVALLGCGDAGSDDTREVVAPDAKEVDSEADLEALEATEPGDLRGPDDCPWVAWDEGLVGGRVDHVVFDPRQPGLVLAGSGGTLARSLDHAATFSPWSEGVTVRAVAFPPDDLKTLLVGTPQGIVASADSGRSFEPRALGGLDIHALLVHPALPKRVFAGLAGAGIMRSDDGGTAFYAVNVGVPRMLVESLAAPSDAPDLVLATGVLQNDDFGPGPSGLILRSTDGGTRWTTVSDDVVWGTHLAFCPSDPQHVVAAVRNGALVSRDAGLTWNRIAGLEGRDVLDLAFAPANSVNSPCTRLWASSYREGVYRLDGDAVTDPSQVGLDLELGRFAGTLAADPNDPEVILTATHAGLFRSADAGRSWTLVETSKGIAIFDLATHGDHAWLATWGNGLWTRTSSDPWQRILSLPSDFTSFVAPLPSLGDRLIVSTATAVYVGSDNAFTPAPGLFNANDAIVQDDELLVATQVAGLQRSATPTATWTASNTNLAPFSTSAGTYIDARAIVADPTRPGRMYLALRGEGVAVSDDNGASWTQPDNALASAEVTRLVIDVAATTRLFALVAGQGIWLSDDGASSWSSANLGLDTLGVADLVLDPVAHRIYASESNGGIVTSDDGHFTSLASWCLPIQGWGALAITTDPDTTKRWLVATSRGNRVVRHPLD